MYHAYSYVHMYIDTCIYSCIYTYMHMYIYARIHPSILYMCVFLSIHGSVYWYYVCICTHDYVSIFCYVRIHMNHAITYFSIRLLIHVCTHTRMHICIYRQRSSAAWDRGGGGNFFRMSTPNWIDYMKWTKSWPLWTSTSSSSVWNCTPWGKGSQKSASIFSFVHSISYCSFL